MSRKNVDNSLGKILKECGLEFLGKYFPEQNLLYTEQLEKNNYSQFKHLILAHKDEIADNFQNSEKAAKKYFLEEIQGYKKVCVVDLGWRGKSISYLKYLFEDKYEWGGKVIGAMIGASQDAVTQNYIRQGVIYTYAFDDEFYRRTGAENCEYMSEEEVICIEALFSAETDTLCKYVLEKNGKVSFEFGKENKNKEIIRQIQKGIMDYVKVYAPIIEKYHLSILPRDAYTPLDSVMQNKKYRSMIYEEFKEEARMNNGF